MDAYANSEWALSSLLPNILYWQDSPTTTCASEAQAQVQVQPSEPAVFASSSSSSSQASTTPPKYCSPYGPVPVPVPSNSGSASADQDNSTSPSSCSSHDASPPPPPSPKDHCCPRSSCSSGFKIANPIKPPPITGKRSSPDADKKRASKIHRPSTTQTPSEPTCNPYGGDGALDWEEPILPEAQAQGDHNYSQFAPVALIAPTTLNYHGSSEQVPQLRHINAQNYTNVPVASTQTPQDVLESRSPVTFEPQSLHYPIGSQNDATVSKTAFPAYGSQHKQQQIQYTSAIQNDATLPNSVQPYNHRAQSQGQAYYGSANDATFQKAARTSTYGAQPNQQQVLQYTTLPNSVPSSIYEAQSQGQACYGSANNATFEPSARTSTYGAQPNQQQVQYTTHPNSVPPYTCEAQSHGQGHYGSANHNVATLPGTVSTSTYGAQSKQEQVQCMSVGRNEATSANSVPQYTYGAPSQGQGHHGSANQNDATFTTTASTSTHGAQSKQQQVHYTGVAQNGVNLQKYASSKYADQSQRQVHYGSANHNVATFPQSSTSTYGAQAQHQQINFPSIGQGQKTRKQPTAPTPRRRESAQYRNIQPATAAAVKDYTRPVSAPSPVNQEFAQYPQNCPAQPAPVPNNYGQRADTNSPAYQNNVPHAQMQSAPRNHTQFVPTSFPVTQEYVSHPHNQPTQQAAPASHNPTRRAVTASPANEIADRFANPTPHIHHTHHENHGQYVPIPPKEPLKEYSSKWTQEELDELVQSPQFFSFHKPQVPYEISPFVQKCTTCNDMTCLQCVVHYCELHYKIPYILSSLARYKEWQCRTIEKPDDQTLLTVVGKRLAWLKGMLESAEKEVSNVVAYHTTHYNPSIAVNDPATVEQPQNAPASPIAAPTVKRNPTTGHFAPGNTPANKGVTKPSTKPSTKPLDSKRVTKKPLNGMPVTGKLWPDENKKPAVRRRGRPSLGPTDTLNNKKRLAVEAALSAAAIPGYTA